MHLSMKLDLCRLQLVNHLREILPDHRKTYRFLRHLLQRRRTKFRTRKMRQVIHNFRNIVLSRLDRPPITDFCNKSHCFTTAQKKWRLLRKCIIGLSVCEPSRYIMSFLVIHLVLSIYNKQTCNILCLSIMRTNSSV